MPVLAWIKSRKSFLKIQEGIGDNLTHQDRVDGFVDYVLWSTFAAEELDLDGELTMECLESGMLLDTKPMSAPSSLPACYYDAFRSPYDPDDIVVLVNGQGGE